MDKELLGITKSLKHFHNIIYGAEILVQTDHKNICHKDMKHTRQWVLWQWILFPKNMGQNWILWKQKKYWGSWPFQPISNKTLDTSLAEIYAFKPIANWEAIHIPLDLEVIPQAQCTDNKLQAVCTNRQLQTKIGSIEISGMRLTTFKSLIWVPQAHTDHIMEWYHISLLHAGMICMLKMINLHFGWPGFCKQVEDFVKICDKCQRHKITGKRNYGKIPLKSALWECKPWAVIHVDCCGPWTVKYYHEVIRHVIKQKIQLLTICDVCTGWPEFVIMLNTTANNAAQQLDQAWFCRYPWPKTVIYDNKTEFSGCNFQELLESYSVKGQPTIVKNLKQIH